MPTIASDEVVQLVDDDPVTVAQNSATRDPQLLDPQELPLAAEPGNQSNAGPPGPVQQVISSVEDSTSIVPGADAVSNNIVTAGLSPATDMNPIDLPHVDNDNVAVADPPSVSRDTSVGDTHVDAEPDEESSACQSGPTGNPVQRASSLVNDAGSMEFDAISTDVASAKTTSQQLLYFSRSSDNSTTSTAGAAETSASESKKRCVRFEVSRSATSVLWTLTNYSLGRRSKTNRSF